MNVPAGCDPGVKPGPESGSLSSSSSAAIVLHRNKLSTELTVCSKKGEKSRQLEVKQIKSLQRSKLLDNLSMEKQLQ